MSSSSGGELGAPQHFVVGGEVVVVGRPASHDLVDKVAQAHGAPKRQLVLLVLRVGLATRLDLDLGVSKALFQVGRRPAPEGRPVARQFGQHQRTTAAHVALSELVARDVGALLDALVVRRALDEALVFSITEASLP